MRALSTFMLLLTLALPAMAQHEPETVAPADHATVTVHDEAAGHGPSRELMTVKPNEALYTVGVFLVFFLVLSFVVWPKILASLQAREEKQRSDLQRAEDAAKQAQATLDQYHQQLTAARQEAQQIIEQSRTDAQKVADQLKKDAQSEMTHMRQRAEADIRAAGEQAIASIYEQAAGLSTTIAGRILQREIDPAAHQALVDQSLQQLQAEQN